MIFLYKIPLCITTALSHCLFLIASHFISSLCARSLWNSMHHDVTSAHNFCTFHCLLHNVNFVPYLQGMFNSSSQVFMLPLYQHLLVHLSLHEINK